MSEPQAPVEATENAAPSSLRRKVPPGALWAALGLSLAQGWLHFFLAGFVFDRFATASKLMIHIPGLMLDFSLSGATLEVAIPAISIPVILLAPPLLSVSMYCRLYRRALPAAALVAMSLMIAWCGWKLGINVIVDEFVM